MFAGFVYRTNSRRGNGAGPGGQVLDWGGRREGCDGGAEPRGTRLALLPAPPGF